MIANYVIQDWLFRIARGRYDVDLAESGVQVQSLGDLAPDPRWDLDYSYDRGSAELCRQVAELYSPDWADTAEDRVMIAHGAQEALYLLYRSFLSPADHVITVCPGWQQSWEVPAAVGCPVTRLYWEPGAEFDVAALKAAIRPDTRLLVLNSPCNPLGTAISAAAWDGILALAREHGLWIVNDEEYLTDFGESVVHRHPRSVSVSGLSKLYGLPALRVGWAVSSPEVIGAMVNYKRYTTVSNSLLCERLAVGALRDRDRHLKRYRELVDAGTARLRAFAERQSGRLELVPPQGTPFGWCRLDIGISSRELAERLLEEQRVLVMPAEVFGAEHGIRITHARRPEVLDEGLARLEELLTTLG